MALLSLEAQRKYEDNCDSLHEESVSEAAENSGEEAGEGALDVEAGEMTDGGEDDYDEEGSHHLVRLTGLTGSGLGKSKALWEISSRQAVLHLLKVNFPELFMATDLRKQGFTWVNSESAWTDSFSLSTRAEAVEARLLTDPHTANNRDGFTADLTWTISSMLGWMVTARLGTRWPTNDKLSRSYYLWFKRSASYKLQISSVNLFKFHRRQSPKSLQRLEVMKYEHLVTTNCTFFTLTCCIVTRIMYFLLLTFSKEAHYLSESRFQSECAPLPCQQWSKWAEAADPTWTLPKIKEGNLSVVSENR